MKEAAEMGLSFGLTSAVLTTVGLFTGLATSLESRTAVISGVLIIAVVDALSDSMGMHLAREAERRTGSRDVWIITLDTFIAKLLVAATFLVPVIFFSLQWAMYASYVWGATLLGVFSYHLARRKKERPWQVIGEHLLAGTLVVVLTYVLGRLIRHFVSLI